MTKQDLIKLLDIQVQDATRNIKAREGVNHEFAKKIIAVYEGRRGLAIQLIDLLHTKSDPADYRQWDSEQPWSGWVI